jgi:hypothetical protein
MGRRLVVFLLLSLALAGSAAGAPDPLQMRASEVRQAIPAVESWYAEHGTYVGMTAARLRHAYDLSIRSVAVRTATRTQYCVQSTLAPAVHYAGPQGTVRTGACGTRGTKLPNPPRPSFGPKPGRPHTEPPEPPRSNR